MITNVTSAQAGSYDCVVTGSCGQLVTSNAASLTINPQTTITAHPQSATVCQGASVTFTVTATGSNLRYQWRKGNTDISGATATSYTITSVALADTGLYACVVSGDCGSATSNQAQLQVAIPPAITSQPASQTRCESDTLVLSVGVSRAIANAYLWKKNGTALNDGGRIQGTRTATLRIVALTAADAGDYTVEITNTICQSSVTSNVAQVIVNTKPTITAEPQSQTVPRGNAVTLSVSAIGEGLRYQWYRNNQAIAGATASTFTIASASDSDAGTYYVEVSNSCGTVKSHQVTITVTNQATPVLELSGSAVTFATIRVGVREDASVVLYNRGTAPLQVTDATLSGSGTPMFSATLNVPVTIPQGDSLVGSIVFAPTSAGEFTATLIVKSNGGERSLQLVGKALARAIAPDAAQFDTTRVSEHSERTIAICNQTDVDITVDSVSLDGDDAAAFQLVPGPWQSQIQTLRPQSNLSPDVPIRFQPTRAGTHRAQLTFHCRQRGVAFVDVVAIEAEAIEATSVAEQIEPNTRLYPNPTSDATTIVFGDQRGMVSIFDLSGRLLYQTQAHGSIHWPTTDDSGRPLPAGMYTVRIELRGGTVVNLPLIIVR